MASSIFPVCMTLVEETHYHLSKKDLSTLVACDPAVKSVLEKMESVSLEALSKLSRLDIVGRICRPFKEFAQILKLNLKSDAESHYEIQSRILDHEDKWFKEGIYCDQLQNVMRKRCRLPTFLYTENKYFKLYQKMCSSKSVKPFDGSEMIFKEGSNYFNYLEKTVKIVKSQEINNMFIRMSKLGTIRV